MKYIDMLPELYDIDFENLSVSELELNNANSLMKKPFEFYGAYAQLSSNKKDEIGESKIFSVLLDRIEK